MVGWTATTLTQAVQDMTENTETSFVANIPYFIKMAEERILHNVDLLFFRKNALGSCISGSKYLKVPNDFLSPLSLSIVVDGENVFLIHKDVEFIQDYNLAQTSGVPRYYSNYDYQNFILGPIPDQDYVAELHYYHKPESILDTGTSWLGTNAEQALLYGTLIEAYIFMKGEADIIGMYTQRFTEAVMRLKNFAEGREDVDAVREGVIRLKAN